MIGLALAGGGARGSYQIGVYMALKKCHIKINGFVGTSIGAFNAAMLASGRDKELLSFWQNVNIGAILGLSDKFILELQENKWDMGLFKEGFSDLKKIIHNKGLKTKELMKVLDNLNIAAYLYKTKYDFGLVTVRFKDLKPLYLFKEDIPRDKLNEYILASCYLPIFRLEKIIDDHYYLDGGFYDNVPANALLNRGYDKVYAVDLKAIGIKRTYQDKKKIIEISPSRKLGSILNCNPKEINDNIKLGYYDTLKIVKKYDGYKYIFKSKSTRFYNKIVRHVSKKVLKEMQKLFRTTDNKQLVIKAVEYVMRQEKFSYFEIYNIKKIIKILKKRKKYGVYRFINQL